MKISVERREKRILQIPVFGIVLDGPGQIFFCQNRINLSFTLMGCAASGQIRPWREQDESSWEDPLLFF